MTSRVLHQIADLLARISRLEVLVINGEIDEDDVIRELSAIRGELYRIATESTGTEDV